MGMLVLSHHALPSAMLECSTQPSPDAEQMLAPAPSLQNYDPNKLLISTNYPVSSILL